MSPKITVVVPVYNTEKYLKKCLTSICRQTLKELEILCINDGTKDNSLYILREFESKFNNIRVINQFNSGVGVARNNGIVNANGAYIAFMDSDDYYLSNDCLEKLYLNAVKNNALICGGSFSEDHGNWIRKEWPGIYEKYTFKENGLIKYQDYQFDYGYYRFIFNRKMLLEHNIFYPPYIRFQDPPFFVKSMITAGQFYAIKDVTYCYRYGHQKLKWNELRTSHVLMGLTDNLRMSKENNLQELNRLTTWRLLSEYKKVIVGHIGKPQIDTLLAEAKKYMDIDYIYQSDDLRNGMKDLLMENL
ncbi:MAG: glycosyltransferase family 2 protein [Acidaminococcaceae bacterium]|nr:glycosyltransferase family 2 protein [Acidaminococcaceae bacterium]